MYKVVIRHKYTEEVIRVVTGLTFKEAVEYCYMISSRSYYYTIET